MTDPFATTRFARESAWRSNFGVTETQAELLIALIAASLLGYDGATAEELCSIGIAKNAIGDLASLARMRLVECLGFTHERSPRKIWGPTPTAFRRFEVPMTAPPPNHVETVEGRAKWAHEQMQERKRRSDQRRRERRQGAA